MEIDSEKLVSAGMWTFTTPQVDRHGDIVDPMGVDLAAYRKNPVVLRDHRTDQPIGIANVMDPTPDGIEGEVFIAVESSDLAAETMRQIESGILRAGSIGFRPIGYEPIESGMRYTKSELMEFSLLSVGSNRQALRTKSPDGLIYKSIEIDTMTEIVTAESTTEPTTEQKSWKPVSPAIVTKPREYSLQKAIGSMLGLPGIDAGYEREIAAEIAGKYEGKSWAGMPVPPGAFTVQKSNAGAAGGNLNPLTQTDDADRLLTFVGSGLARETLADRLGVRVDMAKGMTVKIPIVNGKLTGHIVAQDADIPLSAGSSDSADVGPVTAGARSLLKRSVLYASGGEALIRQQVGQAVSEVVDKALIGPRAAAPTPLGLFDLADTATAGTGTIADTEAAYRALIRELLTYKPADIKLLLPGSLADVLAVTPRFTGAQQAVYSNGMIADVPVVISHELDETTPAAIPLACGDFSQLVLIMFAGGALDVVANPFASGAWSNGGWELRALMDFNVHLQDSAAIRQAISNQS